MALSHAILVSLLDRPQSGYDLAKRFDQTVGYFWNASHQQIYRELHKLSEAGLVRPAELTQADRPNRIVYSLTEGGEAHLHDWVDEPTTAPNVKEELLVKLFALGTADPAALAQEVGRRLAFHQDRLARYEAVMAEYYPDPDSLPPRKQGHYLGLRMGVLLERSLIDWCREAEAVLAQAPR
ncbi:MAG: PadR family transcriptional regulator [Salinisphaeraceae bacterium]|nr:PadR family transcriptional regulator [Salinisphaeraceae bacterium]